ncbi:unnamed protein product [Clavelina lepadiformis]|uniref:Secreted protein n=1 Tax=Clavelina lepadiformis TaxID=159417 RepID=A0ABP0GGD6_CLALP
MCVCITDILFIFPTAGMMDSTYFKHTNAKEKMLQVPLRYHKANSCCTKNLKSVSLLRRNEEKLVKTNKSSTPQF